MQSRESLSLKLAIYPGALCFWALCLSCAACWNRYSIKTVAMLPGDWRVQFVCNLCFPLACQAKRSLFGSFGRIPLSKIICRQNVCFCEHQLDEVARLRAALPIAAVSCEVQIWGHGRRGGGHGPAIFWWCLCLDAYETFQFGKILSPGKARKRRWDCSELHGLCCNHVGIYIVSKKLLTWWEIRPCITLYISACETAAVLPGYSDLQGLQCLRSLWSSLWRQKSWWKISWLRRQALIRKSKD